MKKTVALMVMALAVAMFFTACTKDGQYKPKKKITKIVYTNSSNVEGLTVSTTSSESWTWGGDLLSLIDYYDNNGNRVRTVIFRYDDDKRLVEMEDASYSVTYKYDDSHLDDIEYREISTGKLMGKMEFEYKGRKLATIDATYYGDKGVQPIAFNPLRFFVPENVAEVVMSAPATKGSTVHYTLTWTGNNITELTSDPYGYSVKWTYDDKVNPFKGFLNLSEYSSFYQCYSKNNIIRQEYVAQGNKTVRDYTYEYDGNYPVKTKYQAESSTFVPGVTLMVDHVTQYIY